jgi:hypothetical protein
MDDVREGNYAETVTKKFSSRLKENIEIHNSAFDVQSTRVQENARFFDTVNGLHVLNKAEAIDGLYVETNPVIRLQHIR